MIGPRCALCRKGRKYHGKILNGCPVGKRRNGAYSEFHPTNKFTPREPRKKAGSEKRKDRGQRRLTKSQPCAACFTLGTDNNPCDPAHLRSWKVTQSDHPKAMISLCREHHTQSHRIGWGEFFALFPHVYQLVLSMGWEVTPDPFSKTRVILSHKEIA